MLCRATSQAPWSVVKHSSPLENEYENVSDSARTVAVPGE